MTDQVWRPIPVPEISHIYEVSSLGDVRNIRTRCILKGKYEYWRINFNANGVKNFNKKDMTLKSVQRLRNIIAEDLGCEKI